MSRCVRLRRLSQGGYRNCFKAWHSAWISSEREQCDTVTSNHVAGCRHHTRVKRETSSPPRRVEWQSTHLTAAAFSASVECRNRRKQVISLSPCLCTKRLVIFHLYDICTDTFSPSSTIDSLLFSVLCHRFGFWSLKIYF